MKYIPFLILLFALGLKVNAQSQEPHQQLRLAPHQLVKVYSVPKKGITIDEKQRIIRWEERSNTIQNIKVSLYFDENLKAQYAYREVELGNKGLDADKEWVATLQRINPVLNKIATSLGVDPKKTKILDKVGKRAWFGKRKISSQNGVLQFVFAGANKEPEKYLLFTAYRTDTPYGKQIGHFTWETIGVEN